MRKLGTQKVEVDTPHIGSGRIAVGRMEVEARQREMAQIGAISAFEGKRPSPEYAQIRDRYTSGEIDVDEFEKLVLARWTRHG